MMQQEIYGNGPKKLLIQITNQNHICFMEEVLKTVFPRDRRHFRDAAG